MASASCNHKGKNIMICCNRGVNNVVWRPELARLRAPPRVKIIAPNVICITKFQWITSRPKIRLRTFLLHHTKRSVQRGKHRVAPYLNLNDVMYMHHECWFWLKLLYYQVTYFPKQLFSTKHQHTLATLIGIHC